MSWIVASFVALTLSLSNVCAQPKIVKMVEGDWNVVYAMKAVPTTTAR